MKLRFAVFAFAACAVAAELYHELYRLQFHFSPARTWTNDPNGLVWYAGEFHLFYQNNPFGNQWGHMSWGHAVSPDLLHWTELPVAIPEENGVMIFSGSIVIDRNNSSGSCVPHGSDSSCLVAIYTGHTPENQTQNIAFSNDRGRTWTKYEKNPVIDLHMKNFRDPKVIWHAPTHRWVMVVALPDDHKVRFFASSNLREWTPLSDFGPAGATGGQWECPDLFDLPVGASRKWVLVVNINPGGVQGGSAVQYFTGQFDGHAFRNDNDESRTLWADWGKDFYAATSYFNSPPDDPRRYWIGWFSNWEYAREEPTEPQRGAMAIPRALSLKETPEGARLVQTPAPALRDLRYSPISGTDLDVQRANALIQRNGFHTHEAEIELVWDRRGAEEFGLAVHKGGAEQTLVGIKGRDLFVDRTRSGAVDFHPKFSGRQTAPLPAGDTVSLRVLLDRSSVEVFANDGLVTITDRVFPSAASDGIEFYSRGKARIRSMRMWKLNSTWPDAK